MRVVLEMLASLWNWFLCRFGAVGCLGSRLFHYKVVLLQSCFATSCYKSFRCNTESIRYTHKVDSLHI